MPENSMTFLLSNQGTLKISEHALERMNRYRQVEKDDYEAGGVLLGRFIVDAKDIIIDDVTLPMVGDKQRRHSFVRSAKSHQRVIDAKWFMTKGTCNYLGEWHTHPESYPSYSSTDIKGWQERLEKDKFSSRYLYFIILGIEKLEIWEGDRRTFKFKKLKTI